MSICILNPGRFPSTVYVPNGSFENQHSAWPTIDGKWEMGRGEREMGNWKWEIGNGRWEMGDGKWEMGDGKWEVGNGRTLMFRLIFD